MLTRIFTIAASVSLAAAGVLVPLQTALAMTAEQYFADGNRLFRDDLYWAALMRYRQAGEEGLDTPLLFYNKGVAHYRAGQHIRARASLLRAREDPALRDAAHHNLGLNAYALGDTEEALRWFRLVRDQNNDEKLQSFAVVAISRLRTHEERPDEFEIRAAERKEKREFADLELRARISFGSDDNVFRSPDEPYVDLSDPDMPLVVPVVQGGAFMPVSLSARYQVNSRPFEGFYGAYRMAGRYYQDKNLENGDEYVHEGSFGSEYVRTEGPRKRRVHGTFRVAYHDEVYYDPDNGNSRDFGGVSVDDRMNYVRYGPELSLRQSHEKLSIGLHVKGQLWDYDKIDVLPEYDHEYFLISASGQYKFTSASLLRIMADYYSRRFSDRPAFDLDGQQRIGNPGIRYDYAALALRARQRITDSMWFGFEIDRTIRSDQYVGYNDYTRDSFGVEFHWMASERFDFEAGSIYRLYDYPNAFAFHDPVAGNKTQETLESNVLATFRMTRHLSLVGEARFRETVSNDLRIQYDRTQYVLGVRWEQ
jgi:hypothetical protein